MNNNKEKNIIKSPNQNHIWRKILYFFIIIIIAVICYNIYKYLFYSNIIKVPESNITNNIDNLIEVDSIIDSNISIDNLIEVDSIIDSNISIDNLIEIDSIIDTNTDILSSDIKLKVIDYNSISNIDKINELFDSFD